MALPLAPASVAASRTASVVRRLGRLALDAVLPPRCLACGTLIEGEGTLCATCWPQVRFITDPLCRACGAPFEIEMRERAVCAACAANERIIERVRAAVSYDDGSRRFILALKHADRTDVSSAVAPWMVRAGRELLGDADLLVPIPLHWTRLFVRRYNQAGLLAHAVGRLSAVPVQPDLITRRKRTPHLGHLGLRARAETVRGAFEVPARKRPLVEGRRVLLIDDVFTTGSTTEACARALLGAGARAVDALALAKVVRPRDTASHP